MKKEFFIFLFCLLFSGNFITTALAYDPPLDVDIIFINFNYNINNYTYDAVSIKENMSSDIYQFEWQSDRSLEIAYIKGLSDRRIEAKFYHNQDPNQSHTATICCHTSQGTGIGYSNYTTVYFNGGDSGVLPSHYSSTTTFQCNGTLPGTVGKRSFKLTWEMVAFDGENCCLTIGTTGWHDYYTLLGAPQNPMSIRWTDVLDYACDWAASTSNEGTALNKITEKAYTNFGKNYNGSSTHAPGNTLHLTSLLASSWADCRDMSAVVHVFTRTIGGIQTDVRLINSTTYGFEDFKYKSIDPVGTPSWVTGWWNFHQVTSFLGLVYDACLKLDYNSPRIPRGEDINGSYKNDLFDPVTGSVWMPKEPFSYTTID